MRRLLVSRSVILRLAVSHKKADIRKTSEVCGWVEEVGANLVVEQFEVRGNGLRYYALF